jgi:hypothetical protein
LERQWKQRNDKAAEKEEIESAHTVRVEVSWEVSWRREERQTEIEKRLGRKTRGSGVHLYSLFSPQIH